jgi:hypothetical protein
MMWLLHAVNCSSPNLSLFVLFFFRTRIPITESNKEGRLNCRLCSESQGNSRSTSWMCSVCEVPLCIQTMDGDETNDEAHHVKFHTMKDLIAEHKVCNAKLSDVRGARK